MNSVFRNDQSNVKLCAVRTELSINSEILSEISLNVGASSTSSLLMPVNEVINGGMIV